VLRDIWVRDHTAWKEEPTEIADRLGWLDAPELMARELSALQEFARDMRAGGKVNHIVLCGMGGSSLAPQTFRAVLGGGMPLTVLDTTDPDHIAGLTSSLDPDQTLFVVSSKSGTTVETRAQLEHFWKLSGRGDRFVAITDPDTPLATLARERGFVKVFENPPDIGGRFSALSYFGLVPAALAGADPAAIVEGARRSLLRNGPGVASEEAPGVRLGSAMGEAKLTEARDKLTLVLPGPLSAFGAWIEQLIAESTGKEGNGVLPVVGEDLGAPISYGDDRLFCIYTLGDQPAPSQLEALEEDHPIVRIRVPAPQAIGAEMYRWEMATAVLGYLLDINPFDQPDVESAKQRTRELLESSSWIRPEAGSASDALATLAAPTYVAIQAFVTPSEDNARRLHAVRMKLRDRYRVAVTVGFGPRYLHSTGQFHKGGPNTGVFLQVTGPHTTDVDVPGAGYTFGRLIDAQADGDLAALRDAGRPVARLSLEDLERLASS
jgi:glucose-6-phosphate isomerase